jgi:hypothetical protein
MAASSLENITGACSLFDSMAASSISLQIGAARLSYANTLPHLCITIRAHGGIFDEEREIEKTTVFYHNAVVKYAPSSYNAR